MCFIVTIIKHTLLPNYFPTFILCFFVSLFYSNSTKLSEYNTESIVERARETLCVSFSELQREYVGN